MSARMYPDVSVLLTLDYEQDPLLRKCTIFKNSIRRSGITCYMLSTVKAVRDAITKEVVAAGGDALRGLWFHLSMYKGGGVPNVLDNAYITDTDIPSVRDFFRQKMQAQKKQLAKTQIQIVEVWAIEVFQEMKSTNQSGVPVMEYLRRLSLLTNEYYVESKNALLRTENELNLAEEEPVDPRSVNTETLENALGQVGFDDKEDLDHIACLIWLKEKRGYIPIFATADRNLCLCRDVVYQNTGVIIEDALYAAQTYKSIVQKTWPVRKASQ